MELPEIVDREDWLKARKDLLAREKACTRAGDALNADRRRLPMVRVDEDYTFEGRQGTATLADLFEGRRQLVVYHFMFHPDWDGPCPSCSGFGDGIGDLSHLNARSTTFAGISRAPYDKIATFQDRMGWRFPWYSSGGSRFNYDYHATLDGSVVPVEYNYRDREEWAGTDTPMPDPSAEPFDLHALSCFLRDGNQVFHTYSTYGRGTEGIGATTRLLDLTALGRQEEWEEPKGRLTGKGAPAGSDNVHYHDDYED
jgi:predicted dithiol-disulfide oxidoreductase (DUF899 family)